MYVRIAYMYACICICLCVCACVYQVLLMLVYHFDRVVLYVLMNVTKTNKNKLLNIFCIRKITNI